VLHRRHNVVAVVLLYNTTVDKLPRVSARLERRRSGWELDLGSGDIVGEIVHLENTGEGVLVPNSELVLYILSYRHVLLDQAWVNDDEIEKLFQGIAIEHLVEGYA